MLNNVVALFAGGAPAAVGDYESIYTATVGSGGATSITFSSIPSTYKHLQIRGIAKIDKTDAASADFQFIQFNSDTTYTNYRSHYLEGSGSGTPAAATVQSSTYPGVVASTLPFNGSGQASVFAGFFIDILDYANTNKYKTVRTLGGEDWNGAGYIDLDSGLWMSTSAISSIVLKVPSGYSNGYQQYSHFALYGIKG